MRTRQRCLLLLLFFGSCVLGSCGLNGRSLVYPGASVYQPSTKDFHFHYLAPPWRVDPEPPAGVLIQLSVPASSQGPGTINSSHQLRLFRTQASSPQSAAEAQLQDEQKRHHILVRGPLAITTLTGERGFDLHSYQDAPQGRAFYRESFFSAASGQVIRFSLLSAYATDEMEVDDVILSFSAGPDPGTPGPEKAK